MNQHYNSWEEILAYASLTIKPFSAVEPVSCDHAWGSRIESIFLEDLSQDERRSLAEHVKTCSACAARIREYHELEEYARKLPYYQPDVYRCHGGARQSHSKRKVCKKRDIEHMRWEKEKKPIIFVSLALYLVQLLAIFPLPGEINVKLGVELVVFVCTIGAMFTALALNNKN